MNRANTQFEQFALDLLRANIFLEMPYHDRTRTKVWKVSQNESMSEREREKEKQKKNRPWKLHKKYTHLRVSSSAFRFVLFALVLCEKRATFERLSIEHQ